MIAWTVAQNVLQDQHNNEISGCVVAHTVIRFLWVSAKFGTCTVVSVNGTLVEYKMRTFKGECAQFSFKKCPIYTHDGASAKFSTDSQEMDNSADPTCCKSGPGSNPDLAS